MSPRQRDRAPRMAYSPSTRAMRRIVAAVSEAERSSAPVEEILGEANARREVTRRDFLVKGAVAGGALAVGSQLIRPQRGDAAAGPRIAIVGGGLAGIRTADRLWRTQGARLRSTVFEAETSHIGGRCWSLRSFFSDGLIGEHGGAFINSDQWAIRKLVKGLGLELEAVGGGDLPEGEQIYWFDDAPYTVAEATADWLEVRDAFRSASRAAPFPQLFHSFTPEGKRLDNLSIPGWLDEVGIGVSSRFGRLLMANSVSEYGGDPQDQSSLNLIGLLGLGRKLVLVNYDENYHVVGGNDQIVSGMVRRLPKGTVRQGYALVALAERSGGDYRLTFDVDGTRKDVIADHVVLALPFTALREVDLSRANFTARKMDAIRTMGMGSNAKIHVEVARKTWPALGYSGSSYTDWTGYCVAWDDSVQRGPHGRPAILLGFPGGRVGKSTLTGAAHGTAPAKDVRWFLDQIEPVFPGTKTAYTGRAYEDHWSADPWHKGAYSYYRVGQYTTISGIERVQQGRVHFAGEHTDFEQQGFLDGAVQSGNRAAAEIIAEV